jgi:THO complex subunit 4
MSSNLDRSLDEILAASRPARRGAKGAAPSGPTGGVRKRSQRVAAQKANVSVTPNAAKAAKAVPIGPSGKVSASKIIVSNLVSSLQTLFLRSRILTALVVAIRC